ncbi:MAG TPA: DUF2505 family protein [Polyangiaceae bacterium]|nr:DUF2505 family protein [Polyangiaceae bacterium]
MATTRFQHEFDCTEGTLCQVLFFDAEFNRRLYLETLRFPTWRILDQKITDDAMERRVDVQPLVENVPAALKKVMGDKFGYVEEGKLDRKTNRYRFRVIPSSMADKTTISGEIYSEPIGDKRARRIVDFNVEVKIMLVGKTIEQKTIDDTKASYEKMASFLRSYLKEKGLATS